MSNPEIFQFEGMTVARYRPSWESRMMFKSLPDVAAARDRQAAAWRVARRNNPAAARLAWRAAQRASFEAAEQALMNSFRETRDATRTG